MIWNRSNGIRAAHGKEKRLLSHELIFRLRDKFGPGGMIHHGQGKWYPGELLPRWQYGLFWRKDGYPIWKNPGLIANEKTPHAYTYIEANTFIQKLSKYLAVSADNISAAYQDVFFFLWSEGKTPVNINPFTTNLTNSIERKTEVVKEAMAV